MKNTRTTPLALAGAFLFLFTAAPTAAQSELLKLEAVASYYGAEFNGKPTSSGEIFDMNEMTAAHKTLPFGTILEVTNLENGKKVAVRVNDRGPFVAGRELDVSKAAAEALGMIVTGTARVSIRKLAGAIPAEPPTSPLQPVAAVPATVEPAAGESAAFTAAAPKSSGTADSGPLWRIQLGSFSKEENATRLAVRLRADGFNPAFEKNETLIRVVLTGIPETELQKTRIRLETAGYPGFLVRRESW